MISTPITSQLVRGAVDHERIEGERFGRGTRMHRLPSWVRDQFPDPRLMMMESQPSGVRLALRTSASVIELVTHSTRLAYRGLERPRGCLDVFVNEVLTTRDVLDGGDVDEIDLASGQTTRTPGPTHTTRVRGLPEGRNRVEVWLPHNETLDLIDLRADAPIEPDPTRPPRWVHHGSSISQGSNALAPSDTWPAVAARRARVDLVNLGLGGNAMVDPFLARVIRDLDADCISVKLGVNVVNADAMRLRAFVPAVHGFLDTIRDGHPDTPIMLVSPLFCAIHEHTPGPGAFDAASLAAGTVRFVATGRPDDAPAGRLTLTVVRRELRSLVDRRASDAHLHYLDGTALYGPDDAAELPLPDALHPSPAAHLRIGNRFAACAFTDGGPFAQLATPAVRAATPAP